MALYFAAKTNPCVHYINVLRPTTDASSTLSLSLSFSPDFNNILTMILRTSAHKIKHSEYNVHFIKFKPDPIHIQHRHFVKCVMSCCCTRISFNMLVLHPTLFSHLLDTCIPSKAQIILSQLSSCALYASSRLTVSITIIPFALTSFFASNLRCPIFFLSRHAFVGAIPQVDVPDPLLLIKSK